MARKPTHPAITIKVSGKLLRPPSQHVYLLLHKPIEVVATLSDPEGRASLRDLLRGVPERVFPVGRLEYHSSGAVFLTNDGDLANRILQSHRLPQTYDLKLKSLLTFADIESLSRSTGARITRLKGKEMPWYEVSLREASRDALRNRLFQMGNPVEKIRRVAIGNLQLGSLAPGRYREVTPGELAALSRLLEGREADLASQKPKRASRRSARATAKRPAKSSAVTQRRSHERKHRQ